MLDRPSAPDAPVPACPHCGGGRAAARSVEIQALSRTVTYLCPDCQRAWDQTTLDDTAKRLFGLHRPQR
jgi:hypothetical protein